MARAIRYPSATAAVLARLAVFAPHEQRVMLLDEALAEAALIAREGEKASVFGMFVQIPTLRQADAALAQASEIRDASERADALIGLLPHLPVSRLGRGRRLATTAAKAIAEPRDQVEAFVHLAPTLPSSAQRQAYRAAASAAAAIPALHERVNKLAELADLLPERDQQKTMAMAAKVASRIEPMPDRWDALVFVVSKYADRQRTRSGVEVGEGDRASRLPTTSSDLYHHGDCRLRWHR